MNNSFLPTMIGYFGALAIVVGCAYYVFRQVDLSWQTIETIAYVIVSMLLALPATTAGQAIGARTLRLTSFLGVIALPILIMLSLDLHMKSGGSPFLAGSLITAFTASLSMVSARFLDSNIIAFYGLAHSLSALHFVAFHCMYLMEETYRFEFPTLVTVSCFISFFFIGLGACLHFNSTVGSFTKKISSYAIVLGLISYILMGSVRTLVFRQDELWGYWMMNLLMVLSIGFFYYAIECFPGFGYVEIPLNVLTCIYVMVEVYNLPWSQDNFPLYLILTGLVLYGLSIAHQMYSVRKVHSV